MVDSPQLTRCEESGTRRFLNSRIILTPYCSPLKAQATDQNFMDLGPITNNYAPQTNTFSCL